MPIPKSQVPSVDTLSTELGYYTGVKPYRQHDLTLSTKAWRNTYTSSDGIPGTEITDWASDKGNHDIEVMSRKFLESDYGKKHWPPGQFILEYPRDAEELLRLLHQLFWRQNLAAKNNQILKEKRESTNQQARSDSRENSFVDRTVCGFTAANAQSSSPTESDTYRCTDGDKTESAPSRSRRRVVAGQVSSAESDTDSEGDDRQRQFSLIFKRRFVLKTEQYRDQIYANYQAAFSTTSLRPIADIARKSRKFTTRTNSLSQKRFLSLKDSHSDNYPTNGEEEISDDDSGSITRRKVMTRERNISGPAKIYSADDEIDRLQRRTSIRTSNTATAAESLGEGSPPSRDISAADAWTSQIIDDGSKASDNDHKSNEDGSTRKSLSTRKRPLSGSSDEILMFTKKLRGTSSIQEHKRPSSPLTSVDLEHHGEEEVFSSPRTLSSTPIPTASSNVIRIHPSDVSTEGNTAGVSAGLDRDDNQRAKRKSNRIRSFCVRCHGKNTKSENGELCKACRPKGLDNANNPDNRHVAPVLLTPPLVTRQQSSIAKKAILQCRQVSEDSNAKTFTEPRSDQGMPESSMAPRGKSGRASDQLPRVTSAVIPSSDTLGLPTGTSEPQTTPSDSTTTTTKPPPPSPNRKPKSITKHYILAWDSSGSFQEPWSGPAFSDMTIEDLFVQATTHVSGRKISKIKFVLSSRQPGFVGRRFRVKEDDADSLEEVKEEFTMAYKDGLKKGISKFRILLEPELEGPAAAEDSDDVDEM